MRGGFVVALYRLCRNAGNHSIVWDILVYNSICPDYHIVAYMHRLNNLHAGAYIAVVANHTAPIPIFTQTFSTQLAPTREALLITIVP